jgi:hypothetical protein
MGHQKGVVMRRIRLLAAAATLAGLLAAVTALPAPAAAASGSVPAWAGNPRLDGAAQVAANVIQGIGPTTSLPLGTSPGCPAEASTTGNVQVNCTAEDGISPQNTQSETSVAVSGQKVVVGFNDSLVCCFPALNLSGYSVSTDGGASFTDEGTLPFRPDVQPIGDPTVATDGQGNFFFASLALGSTGLGTHSKIAFYEMPKGSSTFQLVSVPVDVGSGELFFADKEYLAIGQDASGKLHFYITWTFFSRAAASPIMLTQSTDGVHWTTTMVSDSSACAQGSNPVPAGNTVYVSWEQSVPAGCTNALVTAQHQMMATATAGTGSVSRITTIAAVNGDGDKIVACNRPTDLREVIETAPGHDIRNAETPSTTIDPNGILYAVWNDRPDGVGGSTSNATRIFLSFSLDGNKTWSTPRVISPAPDTAIMNDHFQPWITADAHGLHVMWYERVPGSSPSSPDVIQTDKEDLSLATATSSPMVTGPEHMLSSVTFPIVQTNPNQDPIIANCYMGDYNNIVSNGTTKFVTWGDNRNQVSTANGTENQPDVFLQTY